MARLGPQDQCILDRRNAFMVTNGLSASFSCCVIANVLWKLGRPDGS